MEDSYIISRKSAETLLESVDQLSNRHFQKAAGRMLRVLLQKDALNAESLQVCYQIMDHCIRKYNSVQNQSTTFWMCQDRLFWNAFLHLWRDQVLVPKSNKHRTDNDKKEICAKELTQQLISWSRLVPALPYGNANTLAVLVQVAMQQQSPAQAPIVLEQEIIDPFRNEYDIPMNEFLYLRLLAAWTRSGRTEEAPTNIERIVSAMQHERNESGNKIMPLSYYHILLQFWGNQMGDIAKCELLLEEMKIQALPITRTALAPLVSAFCRAKQVHRAEQIMDQMMLLPSAQDEENTNSSSDNDNLVLSNCAREILLYYRDEIKNEFTSDIAQVRFLQAAEQVYHRMVKVLPSSLSGTFVEKSSSLFWSDGWDLPIRSCSHTSHTYTLIYVCLFFGQAN
jgi:pentatricopeptide repeat protein